MTVDPQGFRSGKLECWRRRRRATPERDLAAPQRDAAASAASAHARSSGVVIFRLPASPATIATGRPSRSTSAASSVATASDGAAACALRSTSAANTCGVCASQRSPRAIVATIRPSHALHGVGHRSREDRRARCACRVHACGDRFRTHQRSGRVVHRDERARRIERRDPVGHRMLALGTRRREAQRQAERRRAAPPSVRGRRRRRRRSIAPGAGDRRSGSPRRPASAVRRGAGTAWGWHRRSAGRCRPRRG